MSCKRTLVYRWSVNGKISILTFSNFIVMGKIDLNKLLQFSQQIFNSYCWNLKYIVLDEMLSKWIWKHCAISIYHGGRFYWNRRNVSVFNLCQHFEISISRNANKHVTLCVYITINDNYSSDWHLRDRGVAPMQWKVDTKWHDNSTNICKILYFTFLFSLFVFVSAAGQYIYVLLPNSI